MYAILFIVHLPKVRSTFTRYGNSWRNKIRKCPDSESILELYCCVMCDGMHLKMRKWRGWGVFDKKVVLHVLSCCTDAYHDYTTYLFIIFVSRYNND